jgi:hypothetical protein
MSEPQIKDFIRPNPKGAMICYKCKSEFEKRVGMIGNNALQKGLIMVCSVCGNVSILGDSDLRPLSKEEFDSFPKPKQMAIVSTMKGIMDRLATGQSWSPYEEKK